MHNRGTRFCIYLQFAAPAVKGSQISKTPNMWLDPPLFSVGTIYARQLDVRVAMSGCFVVSFLLIFVTAVLYLFLCISFLCLLCTFCPAHRIPNFLKLCFL